MKTFFLIFLFISSQVQAEQNFDKQMSILKEQADGSCLGLIPVGVCPKVKHVVGALVLLREPSLMIQTIKKSSGVSVGNLQFNEVSVLSNPLAKAFHQSVCSEIPDPSPPVFYISEPDTLEWKQAKFEGKLPHSLAASVIGSQCHRLPLGAQGQCMNTWGPLYPRTGFVVTPSTPVASAVSAVRAVSIAKNPIPGHIIESRMNYSFNLREDKLQMIKPVASLKCISIGQDPKTWDKNKTSKDGQYVWIYWNWRLCCI
jgi:hypothetical protein